MNIEQTPLPFRGKTYSGTRRFYTSAQQEHVTTLLSAGAWLTAKHLCGLVSGLTDRGLRQMAEDSKGAILGGQRGYCLTKHASNSDIDHVERALLSQGRKMLDRAREVRIYRNRGAAAVAEMR